MIYWLAAGLMLAVATGAVPVPDEALRLKAASAIFPGMQVLNKRIYQKRWKPPAGSALDIRDAFAEENVYTVTGPAMNEIERCASEDISAHTFSSTRQVRLKLFRWPNENDAGLLAVLQYDFLGANPAMACPSIGLLVHLTKSASQWSVREQYLLDTMHHFTVQSVRLVDLNGAGRDHLSIESNAGGAGTTGTILRIFDLSRGRFDELLETQSFLQYWTDDWFSQTLDLIRTPESHGQRFCFTKTTRFEDGKAFVPPRVTRPCYKRGDGIDNVAERDRQLLVSVFKNASP